MWCPIIWRLWSNLMNWWELNWVTPDKVEGLVSIWKTRNECIFNGKLFQMEELCDLIKVRVALWVKAHSKDSRYQCMIWYLICIRLGSLLICEAGGVQRRNRGGAGFVLLVLLVELAHWSGLFIWK
ncbi:unnamed protein product [Camellia sinensis]